jgi:hypothetical protein
MVPTVTLDTELTTHQAGTKYMWIENKLLTYLLLTPWRRVLLVKLTSKLVKKFPEFMEPVSPSPYPQVPAMCPYPEPTPSNPHDRFQLPEDPF